MRREYESGWSPAAETRLLISQADEIARQYAASGYGLTLRQMYYQFVSKDLLPNSDKSYKRLGAAINKARMAGMIDWSHLTDRTRNPSLPYVGDPPTIRSILSDLGYGYTNDAWEGQDVRVEVWVEKEALAEVVQRAASRLGCGSLACRGYMSASEMWEAGRRFSRYIEGGQRVVVLHLGDHDPSGMDMTRDIRERLETFVYGNWAHEMRGLPPSEFGWAEDPDGDPYGPWSRQMFAEAVADDHEWDVWDEPAVSVERIALNWDQIQEYGPPPNPAKLTDARGSKYVEEFGPESWELDALPPDVLATLIRDRITAHLDVDMFNAQLAEKRRIQDAINEATADVADRLEENI